MAFRKDRVRVLTLYSIPAMSAQTFEAHSGGEVHAFLQLPVVQKKSTLNVMTIIEVESREKINEILKEPAFQKIFEDVASSGNFDTIVFSGDLMMKIDK